MNKKKNSTEGLTFLIFLHFSSTKHVSTILNDWKMSNVMAALSQEFAYYHFMACVTLLKKQDIVRINV